MTDRRSTPHVALAGCRRTRTARAGDLYPDPDAGPLRHALADLGADSTHLAWDDPAVEWGRFGHVLVSSTWDGVDHPDAFLGWARRVAATTRLVNPAPVVEWGFDKAYLRELGAAGVPVIPTTWVEPGEVWEPTSSVDVVVKPAVSAGGRDTARYRPGDPAASTHVQGLQRAGRTVMVQDHLPAIDVDGEVDAVFVAGRLSHAVGKRPALRAGQGVVERPWERMAWTGLVELTGDQREVATTVMALLAGRFDRPPTYALVDLVPGAERRPLVLEVEVVEPYLSLDLHPEGAARLARALLAT